MIPEQLVRELRYVELRTSRRIRNLRAGAYVSRLRGDGFDFDQHRLYRPGDDVRRIDWNVTARFGMPFLRQTHAERELDVVLAVDVSRSMKYVSGRRSRREALTLVTASLLFSAAADQINTGFLAFSDRVESWMPPTGNKARAWTTLAKLWDLDVKASRTAMVPAAEHLIRSLKRMTLVLIISDFTTDEDLNGSRAFGMLATRHDVVAVVIGDKTEDHLPAGSGHVRVRDLESGTERTIKLNGRTRAQFAEAVQTRRNDLTRFCYRVGIDPVFVDTNEDVVEPMLAVFERRR